MKYSIKRQFAFIFIGMLAGTIMLCWFINTTFLEKFYIQNKKAAIYDAYDKLNTVVNNGDTISEEFAIEIEKICGRYNISVIIIDMDSEVMISRGNDTAILKQQLYDKIFGPNLNTEDVEFFDGEDGTSYVLQNVMDQRTNSRYLEMWGMMGTGKFFMIRSPIESIQESVKIANRFLAYVGIFAVIASGIIIWFVSKKVTEPIMELTEISDKISHLDFEVKYSGKSKNEVALLGANINKLSAALETTISELKIANNELKKDIERKEQIDEMRKEFLSNVSHELKTPIALIQGYAEGLKEGINDDLDSKDFYCDVIMDESAKMNNMVKKLLTLNELEFGNDKITMERFDVVSLISNYIQSAQILTRQNGVNVKFDVTEPVYVWADEFKTEEVFMNYFTNAVNYAQEPKEIEVKIVQLEKTVRVSVYNTGAPIPEEAMERIWDKFYKVDKARTREYGGSGVGLSIVKAVMNSMNQKFGVNNRENGVEFWFELDTNVGQ